MSYYFVPAVIGLLSKVFILRYATKNKGNATLIALIAVFACHNAIELVGYIRFLDNQAVATLFRAYYAASILALLLLTLHTFSVVKISQRIFYAPVVGIAALLSLAIMFTDTVITGSYSIGYAMTATNGEYYFLFSLFSLSIIIATPTLLVNGYRKATNDLDSIRCAYSLFALVPLLIICLIVLVLKTMEVNLNLAAIVPLATTLFLLVMLKGESKHKLTDVRRLMPFSKERKAAQAFLQLTDNYAQGVNGINSYNDLRDGLERQIILYTLEKCDDNVTHAAKMMGLKNRSSLYSMMKRLDIKISDL